jgi:hypothetical protein
MIASSPCINTAGLKSFTLHSLTGIGEVVRSFISCASLLSPHCLLSIGSPPTGCTQNQTASQPRSVPGSWCLPNHC